MFPPCDLLRKLITLAKVVFICTMLPRHAAMLRETRKQHSQLMTISAHSDALPPPIVRAETSPIIPMDVGVYDVHRYE